MVIQDRYRIESLVAKGSMGVIYRATQQSIDRAVAIKVMHGYLVSDEESMKRYHKEAKAASRLNHPNITTIFDFGVLASGQPYIVMDLLTGKALADILKERGQLTPNQCLMVMNQTCQALAEAHARGVVHRDVKPENIVIDELPDGRNIHVKVVDFGIATFAAEGEDTIGKITKTGTVCGSPFYMSPEQCDGGKVDKRSDLYSLGIVLFECLTGKVPFESKDIYQVLTMQVKDPPPRLKKVRPDLQFSDEVELVVNKALAKEPDARFQTAQEFWATLAHAGGLKVGKRPEPTSSIMRPGFVTNLPPDTIPPNSLSAGQSQAAAVSTPSTKAAPASGEHVLSYAEQIKLQAAAAAAGIDMPSSAPATPLSQAAINPAKSPASPAGSPAGSGAIGSGQGPASKAESTDGRITDSRIPDGRNTGGGKGPVIPSIAGGPLPSSSNQSMPTPSASAPENKNASKAEISAARSTGESEMLKKKIHDSSVKFQAQSAATKTPSKLTPGQILQIVALPLLTFFVTVTLFCVMAIEVMKQSRPPQTTGTTPSPDPNPAPLPPTAESLMTQDKLDEARALLEEKKTQGQLSESDQTTLDWVYIKLSRKEAKAKRFKQAVALLEQVSGSMKEDEEVMSSIRRYKKQIPK